MSKGAGSPGLDNAAARPVVAARGRGPSRGSGRRPGQSSTRTRTQILTAALELFATKGYSGTTMRGITRTFLSCWEDEWTRPALVAGYRTSLSDEATVKAFRDRIEAAFASCLGRTAPEETERTPAVTSLVSAQLAGLVMLRHVLAVEPQASPHFEDLMEWLVLAIEGHFDRLPQEEARASAGRVTAADQVRVGFPRLPVPSRALLMFRRTDSRCPVRAPGR
ncbi:TetR/AcrR family transcriptional regulator [Streptomyces sp. NPDC054919]